MLLSPSFLRLMFSAVLYPSPTYSPTPLRFSFPCSSALCSGASGVNDGDVAGQVGMGRAEVWDEG